MVCFVVWEIMFSMVLSLIYFRGNASSPYVSMGAIVEFMIFVMVALPRLPWLKPLIVISEWAAFALADLARICWYVAIFVGLVSV